MQPSEPVDPAFTYTDNKIDELKESLLENELGDFQDQLLEIKRLLVQQRMMAVWLRIHERVQNIMILCKLGTYGEDIEDKCKRIGEILSQHRSWFWGACKETQDPYQVFEEWVARLKRDFARLKVDTLLDPEEELFPRPLTSRT